MIGKACVAWQRLGALALAAALAWAPEGGAQVRVERLLDRPIIEPGTHPSIGENIQGPSLVRVPDWVPEPLGAYYLYFADHKGRYIRLAYADALTGPWQVHEPGSLRLEESRFLTERPTPSAEELAAFERRSQGRLLHSALHEITAPHIASPDVLIDHEQQRFVMYFHGLEGVGRQVSRVATSADGIHFTAHPETIRRTYLRAFKHAGMTYLMAMPGQFYRSQDGLTGFEEGPLLFNADMRHAAPLKRGDTLHVFWTQVGDAPERILLSRIDLRGDWQVWRESEAVDVLRPEREWEGANAPVAPSVRSVAYGVVNQLRDPAIFVEDGRTFLLYAVAGERGIGIAEVFFED